MAIPCTSWEGLQRTLSLSLSLGKMEWFTFSLAGSCRWKRRLGRHWKDLQTHTPLSHTHSLSVRLTGIGGSWREGRRRSTTRSARAAGSCGDYQDHYQGLPHRELASRPKVSSMRESFSERERPTCLCGRRRRRGRRRPRREAALTAAAAPLARSQQASSIPEIHNRSLILYDRLSSACAYTNHAHTEI